MATTTKRAIIWNTTAGNKTTPAFTPLANDLLIAVVGLSGSNVAPTSITDSQSGTWDLVGTFQSHSTAVTGGLRIYARTAAVAASSTTVTMTSPGGDSGGGLAVFSVTGASGYGAAAIRAQGGVADQAAGTPAVVLPQAALTGNSLIGAVMTNTNGSANCAPPAGWAVEDYDQGYNTPATGLEVCHRDTGETNTTITFGAATPSQFGAIVIEIIAVSGTADLTVTLYQGATAKASKVITGTTNTLFGDDAFTLTGTEADSITDYTDLRLGFKATATGGLRVDVAWAELEVPGSPPNALVNAATVAVTASVPAPSPAAGSILTTTTVAGAASVDAPTPSAGAGPTPSTLAATATTPSVSALGGAIASGVDYYDSYNDSYSDLPVRVEIPTPTVIATSGGAATATPSTVAAVATVPTPTVLAGSVTATPATVAATTSIATPTVLATSTVTPSTVASVSTVGAPTTQGEGRPTPGVVAGVATVPAPTITGTAVVVPSTVAGVAQVPTPGIIVGGNATVVASTVSAVASVPAAVAQGAALKVPVTVAGTTTVGIPTLVGTAIVIPPTVQTIVLVPAPIVFGGSVGFPVDHPMAVELATVGAATEDVSEGKATMYVEQGEAT